MKRRGQFDSYEDGGQQQRRASKRVEVDNPYLAHVQVGRRQKRTFDDSSMMRRRRKDGRALLFHNEEEEDQVYEAEGYYGSEHSRSAGLSSSEAAMASSALRPDERRSQQAQTKQEDETQIYRESTPMKNLDTPGMEWWDVNFLPKEMREEAMAWNPETAPYDKLSLDNQKSTMYVEHPVPIQPTKASMDSDEPLKLYQTKAELKRIRRLNRAKLNKEKQDKIALGLIPPPPPKIKISNLLRVLSEEHTADPSAIEAMVKQEMELRERQHMARNLARKLTPEERIAKVRRRIEKDAQCPTVHFAVFRVTNMELMQEQLAKKRMVKMLLTARKLMINGRVVVVRAPLSTPTLVYAEGGPKSMRKFIRLMLRRINWKAKTILEAQVSRLNALDEEESEVEDDDDASSTSSSSSSSSMSFEDDEADPNAGKDAASSKVSQPRPGVAASCKLVWRATSTRREYDGFRREVFDASLDARQFLQAKNLGHLWDAVVAAKDGDDSKPVVAELL